MPIFTIAVKADDPRLIEALTKYHSARITDEDKVSELLLTEHNIKLSCAFITSFCRIITRANNMKSGSTVKRRWKAMGLLGPKQFQFALVNWL